MPLSLEIDDTERLNRDVAHDILSEAAPVEDGPVLAAMAVPARDSELLDALAPPRGHLAWLRLPGIVLLRYVPVMLVLLAWEAAPRLGLVDPHVLPPFSVVVQAWIRLLVSGDLLHATLVSLGNLSAGLALGIAVGVALGIASAASPAFEALISPLVKSLYPMPKSALIPVMILWFGMGSGSIIASIFMGCLLPVTISTYNGARGVDRTLRWSALALGARRGKVLLDIVLPASLPEILAGVRTGLGISFIILIAAEFLFGQAGLGYLISLLGDGGVYPGMFAAVLTISMIGFCADRLYLMLMRRALTWRD